MKLLPGILICLIAATASATAVIGVYAGETGEICEADIDAGGNVTLLILARIDPFEFSGGITAAEFRIDNLPSGGGYPEGVISPQWTSTVVVGDLFTDFSIAWSSPQYGPLVTIGSVNFQAFDGGWIGTQRAMEVMEGDVCGCIAVVDDYLVAHEAAGGRFTFNCGYDCGCGGIQSTESDWGEVKTLY